jgi:putative ABC transport system permease protein
VARAREPIRWLFYASMAVLVVSCLNLAAAILAQGLNRTRELSIRLALGASRLLLVRNVIMEALALAVPAVVAGLALAAAALAVIRAEGAAALPRLDEAGLDATAALTAVAAALGTAVLAGLVPALALVSRGSMERLRTHGVAPASGHRRLWPAFIAVQVALSLLLLTGTGLLVRSFVKAIGLDLGYSAAHVLAVDVSLPADAYAAPARKAAYYDAALEHLRATPGLVAAGLTNVLPHETSAYTASTEREARGSQSLFSGYRLVDEGYFDALDIPSLRIDRAAFRAGGALIDRTLQHALWQDQAPEGDRFTNSFSDRVLTVAGVVGTVRELTQDADTTGAVYVDYHTRPAVLGSMHFVVRYAGSEAAAADAVRRAMAAVDPLVPVTIEPLRERATAVLGDRRFLLIVAAAFGAIALLLSAVGVHALVTFSVSRSRREAAIRLALGAAPSIVRAGVARRGLVPAAVGTALGLLGSIWLGQALHSQLFQVSGVDPLVLAGAAGATLAAAGGAALAPARRIARVAPAEALREESLIPYP